MKKLLFMTLILTFLTANASCGGGDGSSANTSDKTTVTISLGEARIASHAGGGLLSATSTIPSELGVTSIKFTISATDMVTIERVISVAGRTTISESFEVPTGANRHFLVEAMDASGNVLYRGETFANLDGTPTSLTIAVFFSGSGEITDLIGDARSDDRVPISPDLASATITVSSGSMTINVRFATGTFNPNTTFIQTGIDTDQNPSTGHPGSNASGIDDNGIIGTDYIVDMGSDYYGNQAEIMHYAGTPNSFTHVGYVPVTYVGNGMDVIIPLSIISNDDGRLNFKVTCATQISPGGFTGVLDTMPDIGLPPGIVQ